MATELIKLQHAQNILVEVSTNPRSSRQVSDGEPARAVQAGVAQIEPIIKALTQPLIRVWEELNGKVQLDGTELDVGLSFEAEGNLYITKAKAEASLTLKLILKPKKSSK